MCRPIPPRPATTATARSAPPCARPTPPADFEVGPIKYTYLATEKSTGGDFGLYRVDLGPKAGGPGPHFHKAMSESFFVLSGRIELFDGSDWTVGEQGDYLYVPPGGIHGFGNQSDEPASILMLFAPGAPREFYFEGGLPKLGELTDDERREFFIRNDNFLV